MPTEKQVEQLAAALDIDIKRTIAADVDDAKSKIGEWVATTFPPARGVCVAIALLQFAIETQLTMTGDEEHSRKLINHIFNDIARQRRGPVQ